MKDNEQIILFRQVLDEGLALLDVAPIPVLQFNQPTLQGTSAGPCYYFSKISERRIAFSRYDLEKAEAQAIGTSTQVQRYETTWQMMALAKQTPGNPMQWTAGDWLSMAADILNSDPATRAFANNYASILRVTDIRAPVFLDDNDEFIFAPSFDFVLVHNKSYSRAIDFVDQIDSNPEQV